MMRSRLTRDSGAATIPPEAWDHSYPDHDWWTNGRSWCFDRGCPDHAYGRPGSAALIPWEDTP